MCAVELRSGLGKPLEDLAGGLLPLSLRTLQDEIEARIAEIPNELNSYGFDPYGFSPAWLRQIMLPCALLYRHYFRVECHDIDRVPAGRVLVIANHAGQLPADAAMLNTALLLEAQPPRVARGMGEFWIPRLPWISVMAARSGAMVGTPENCVHMLENEECVVAFPEGVRGMNKMYRQRYQLQRFGLGFMRLALETGTPILPVAIVGSEEQQPGLANLETLARLLRMPAFPLTPTFPWLGPLGLLPFPVKYRMYFGEPMEFEGDANDEDASIGERVEEVAGEIERMLQRGLRERRGVFV